MNIRMPFFLALWASEGIKMITYTIVGNWALTAISGLYMLLWAWVLQTLHRMEERA